MAWRSHGKTHLELVDHLYKNNIIKSDVVYKAMLGVDRGDFCSSTPYLDNPQPIGSNVTISAPHMHAYALEILKDHLTPGNSALDVGCGSGYLSACMAHMVGEEGRVTGLDHIQNLVTLSKNNTEKSNKDLFLNNRLRYVVGDGREGLSEGGPYDAIHVGAAAPHLPKPLLEQLAPGGRLVCPVGTSRQNLVQVDKDLEGRLIEKILMGVMYVPLTDKNAQVKKWQN